MMAFSQYCFPHHRYYDPPDNLAQVLDNLRIAIKFIMEHEKIKLVSIREWSMSMQPPSMT